MSLGLLGNKIGMTQIFDESGNIVPVTILKIGPCVITQIKTVLICVITHGPIFKIVTGIILPDSSKI